jgi:hypothetical protein
MKLKAGINLLPVVFGCVCLAPPVNTADAPAQPPNITVRDGQHENTPADFRQPFDGLPVNTAN